ncbi:hypothetical protein K8P63_04600 [Sphingomonas nostoxanthinifaciens]|nr:hypothetical protein K8P63_04600 [Sphingomonas nostoxanthinifaciens]
MATTLPIFCDESLKAFDIVYPAAGSLNSSVAVSPDRLADVVDGQWVDICRLPEPKID